MAKRKRLTPAQPDYLSAAPAARPAPGPLSSAPIAQVAGEASASAALDELSAAMRAARDEGRLIEALPLAAIDPAYLVRDRLVQDAEEMAALMASLAARGQQTPIEVVALPRPAGGHSHGLISGWRRLTALRQLYARDGDPRFATIRARIVTPDSMQAAYVAMVEENEIRAGLSHYERARIVVQAYREGLYPTYKTALQGLFDSVSRSKRSKIGSFVTLAENLDGDLRFPTAISEKLGLELVRALQTVPDFCSTLRARLAAAAPQTPEEELKQLSAALAASSAPAPAAAAPAAPPTAPRARPAAAAPVASPAPVTLRYDRAAGRIELTGAGIDAAFHDALQAWLAARG